MAAGAGAGVCAAATPAVDSDDAEYPGLYRRFASLIRGGRSEVDTTPFTLVADAFLRGTRISVEAFHD